MSSVEIVWEEILSRIPERVCAVFFTLDDDTQRQVEAHLRDMASEEGWQAEQVISAQKALDAIESKNKDKA